MENKEAPKCRKKIIKILSEYPNTTLQNIAYPNYDNDSQIIVSEGLKIQARKMLVEELKNDNYSNFKMS